MAAPKPRRYAIAALQLALENEGISRWEQDIARAADVLSDDDVRALLVAPQVSDEAKLNGISTLLGDVAPLIVNMVSLMAVRGDIGSFPEVFSTFQEIANEHRGIAQAEVTSAVPLDDERRERIRVSLADITGKEVTMTESIDPQIIGGVVARVGDQLIDGSTRSTLRSLRDQIAVRPAEVA